MSSSPPPQDTTLGNDDLSPVDLLGAALENADPSSRPSSVIISRFTNTNQLNRRSNRLSVLADFRNSSSSIAYEGDEGVPPPPASDSDDSDFDENETDFPVSDSSTFRYSLDQPEFPYENSSDDDSNQVVKKPQTPTSSMVSSRRKSPTKNSEKASLSNNSTTKEKSLPPKPTLKPKPKHLGQKPKTIASRQNNSPGLNSSPKTQSSIQFQNKSNPQHPSQKHPANVKTPASSHAKASFFKIPKRQKAAPKVSPKVNHSVNGAPFTAAMLSIEAAQNLPPVPRAAQDPPLSCNIPSEMEEFDATTLGKAASKSLSDCSSRKEVFQWLYYSEKNYLWSLSTIVDVFLNPLLDSVVSNAKITNSKEIDTIFGVIEEILRVHQQFFGKIQYRLFGAEQGTKLLANPDPSLLSPPSSRGVAPNAAFLNSCKLPFQEKTTLISDLFLQVISLFSRYGTYLYRMGHALKHLKSSLTVDSPLGKFISQAEENPRCHSQTLIQLLSRPVWRLPQYLTCMVRLIAFTPDGAELLSDPHIDCASTKKAFQEIRELCASTDLYVKRLLNNDRIKAIQKSLVTSSALSKVPKILGPDRVFVCDGGLFKLCRKGPKPRHFFLFSDLLVYAAPMPGTRFLFSRAIPISEITAVENQNESFGNLEYGLIIRARSKSFVCYASSAEIRKFWFDCLRFQIKLVASGFSNKQRPDGTIPAAIMEILSNLQKNRDQDSDETNDPPPKAAPIWKPDEMAKSCEICGFTFTFRKRKHHCRSCGKCICAVCSPSRVMLPHINERKPQRVCSDCVGTL